MKSTVGARIVPALALCAAGATLPATTLHFLGREEVHISSFFHFWAVGATAFAATAAALALTVVGARREDARTVIVGTAFSVMAALLALHGLATPGILVELNGLVSFTGGATLPIGGMVLALTSLPSLRAPQNVKSLLVLQALLLGAVALVGVVGMLAPSLVPSVPEPASPHGARGARSRPPLLRLPRPAGREHLPPHPSARRPARRLRARLSRRGTGRRPPPRLPGPRLVARPRLRARRDPARRDPRCGRPLPGDALPGAHRRPARRGARLRGGSLPRRAGARAHRPLGREGRVHRGAHAPGGDAGRAGGRGAGPGAEPPPQPGDGGLLHDIGKLSVPDGILKKPGSLDEAEFAVIRRHPEWGHGLLGELGDFSEAVRRLVLDHHERLDGKGYPRGRRGEELDLETRILAVCDVYDALLSVRVYRPAWSNERAMALLREETNTAFDAGCVAALERVLGHETALSLGVAV